MSVNKLRPHLSKDELRYLGEHACLALWKMRSQDIIRVYVHQDYAAKFKGLLDFCAKHRKSYHLVQDKDLEKLTESKHHEGICVVAKQKKSLGEEEYIRSLSPGKSLLVFLDGVGNPHNLGAVMRSCAHFGVNYLAVAGASPAKVSPAASRTSEGAAEYLSLVRVENQDFFFKRLKKLGFSIFCLDNKGSAESIFEIRFPERAVLILGAEVEGVSPLSLALSDQTIKIPGTGAVESLNVSVAAALAMGEYFRQSNPKTVRIVKTTP